MPNIVINKTSFLDAPLTVDSLHGVTFTNENGAHKFVISCMQGGELKTLTGSVSARFMRANNTTILLSEGYASIEDGKAVVTLHQDCYNVPGRFQLAIFNTADNSTVCIYACVGTVQRSQNGDLIDSGDVVPSIDELLAQIEACETATTAATTAASAANAAAESASTAGESKFVRYDVAQTLTASQQAQARANIGASTGAVLYSETQTLTDAEKATARGNVGAASATDVDDLKSAIDCECQNAILFTQYSLKTNIDTLDTAKTKRGHSPLFRAKEDIQITVSGIPSGYTLLMYVCDTKTQSISGRSTTIQNNTPFTISAGRYYRYVIHDSDSTNAYEVDSVVFMEWNNQFESGIKNVESGLSALTNFGVFPNNLVNPVDITDNAYVRYENGKIKTNEPDYLCTGFIPVTEGVEYISNVGRNYAWYNSNQTYIDGANSTDIQTGITAPNNAAYIRFTVNKTSDVANPYLLYFTTKATYKENVFFGYDVPNAIRTATKQQITGVQFPANMIDISEIVNDAYINVNNGNVSTDHTGYFCTGFIPVTAGVVYRSNVGRNYAWYKSDQSYLTGYASTDIQTGITAPENAAYIRFSVNVSRDKIANGYELYFTESSQFVSDVTIYGFKAPDSKPWCYGKTINWIGDSIVDGPDFDEQVCAALNLTKLTTDGTGGNGGINGSTIALNADGTNTRHALCIRYSDMPEDADIVAVSCGTNDFEYAWCPIGTIESTENNTFYGALKTLCAGLINRYPKSVIFFTTPIKRAQPFEDGNGGEYTQDGVMTTPFSKNKYGKTLGDYADIIKEVCGYYSIPVLDMYRESLLNPHLASQQDMFDNVYTHPNTTGQNIMARRVAGWMTQLGYNID